jgi:hypothetical protein
MAWSEELPGSGCKGVTTPLQPLQGSRASSVRARGAARARGDLSEDMYRAGHRSRALRPAAPGPAPRLAPRVNCSLKLSVNCASSPAATRVRRSAATGRGAARAAPRRSTAARPAGRGCVRAPPPSAAPRGVTSPGPPQNAALPRPASERGARWVGGGGRGSAGARVAGRTRPRPESCASMPRTLSPSTRTCGRDVSY